MAKSKSGGTRAYIRGRVGADVYSIGRDSAGRKQQVVRSLAETVANPQTLNQMRGRMIMYTVMQAVTVLRPIIDHSFDDVKGKQPNISEFIRRNYALVKADVAANPASGNKFGLNQYQERGAKRGAYVVSEGNAVIPSAMVLTKSTGVITITLAEDAVTLQGLRDALSMTFEEYFTIVGISENGNALYERFRLNPELALTTELTADNISNALAVEGNAFATIALDANVITITLGDVAGCCALIISKKVTSGYIHNSAVLGANTGFEWSENIALPTYPVGAANFLNGGDISGTASVNVSGSSTESGEGSSTQSVNQPTISAVVNEGTATVTITAQSGARIFYTTNGQTPTSSSTEYSSPFTLNETATVKAIALLNGVASSVASTVVTIEGEEGGY